MSLDDRLESPWPQYTGLAFLKARKTKADTCLLLPNGQHYVNQHGLLDQAVPYTGNCIFVRRSQMASHRNKNIASGD